ncbi:MAG: hypothetical protein SFT68_03700 [Rickettsiaceae bacterium]|nr:hypothetical protein [Rickettsiaceae bacterium]
MDFIHLDLLIVIPTLPLIVIPKLRRESRINISWTPFFKGVTSME